MRVKPALVVEIAFNDPQMSLRYPRGLALRFACVKRYREDKRPEEVVTIEPVAANICARTLMCLTKFSTLG